MTGRRADALDTLLRLLPAIITITAIALILRGDHEAGGWLCVASAALAAWPAWRWSQPKS